MQNKRISAFNIRNNELCYFSHYNRLVLVNRLRKSSYRDLSATIIVINSDLHFRRRLNKSEGEE